MLGKPATEALFSATLTLCYFDGVYLCGLVAGYPPIILS